MNNITVSIGEIINEEFLIPLNISQYKLAKDIFVSATLIGRIIKGKASVTPDIALRLSKYFNTTVEFWLNLQNLCDIEKAEEKYKNEKIDIKPIVA